MWNLNRKQNCYKVLTESYFNEMELLSICYQNQRIYFSLFRISSAQFANNCNVEWTVKLQRNITFQDAIFLKLSRSLFSASLELKYAS